MAKESFVLVSLKEDKAKKLAQVITNESCKKILDYLTENEATESELATKLNLPISTVHYNLQHLMEASLITAEEYHYSEKGKEVNHYKLANKYIIIAPKSTYGIKEKLRSILPAGLIALAAAGFIQIFSKYFAKPVMFGAQKMETFDAARTVAEGASAIGAEKVAEAAPAAVEQVVEEVVVEAVPQIAQPSIALWFLLGALFVVVVYLIVSYIRKR